MVIEGDEVDQAGPAFPKPMLAGPYVLVLNVLCDDTQDDLFHDFSWYLG